MSNLLSVCLLNLNCVASQLLLISSGGDGDVENMVKNMKYNEADSRRRKLPGWGMDGRMDGWMDERGFLCAEKPLKEPGETRKKEICDQSGDLLSANNKNETEDSKNKQRAACNNGNNTATTAPNKMCNFFFSYFLASTSLSNIVAANRRAQTGLRGLQAGSCSCRRLNGNV